jgi:hypothetical protein
MQFTADDDCAIVFRDVTSCRLVYGYQPFEGLYHLYLQGSCLHDVTTQMTTADAVTALHFWLPFIYIQIRLHTPQRSSALSRLVLWA